MNYPEVHGRKPSSVTTAVIKFAGVTSKATFWIFSLGNSVFQVSGIGLTQLLAEAAAIKSSGLPIYLKTKINHTHMKYEKDILIIRILKKYLVHQRRKSLFERARKTCAFHSKQGLVYFGL